MNCGVVRSTFLLALVLFCAVTAAAQDVVVSEFMAVNDSVLLDEDAEYNDWIEIHNTSASTVVLTDWYLTDNEGILDKWRFPATTVNAGSFLVVFASGKDRRTPGSELHTNFKLSSDGEDMLLVWTNGATVIHGYEDYPDQSSDISYGTDTNGMVRFFSTPSPGLENIGEYLGVVADTKFSVDRGFYETPFLVAVTTKTAGATIKYTTDGSTPSPSQGQTYEGPLSIGSTTVLRAMAYLPGYKPTDVDTHTYLFIADVITQPAMAPAITGNPVYGPEMTNSLRGFPVISLVTDHTNMWGVTGIYDNPGERGIAWERPVSVELFDAESNEVIHANAGIRIHGADARGHQKKPFRVFFRSQYGPPDLTYPFFPDANVTTFSKFVLRPGAHDSWVSPWGVQAASGVYIRDEFVRASQRALGQPSAHSRRVHLYINGTYWGMYEVTERPDATFSSTQIGGAEEDWDTVHGHGTVELVDGTIDNWNTAVALANAGLSDNADYEVFTNYVDIDGLIGEIIVRTYGQDVDWIRSESSLGHTSDRNKNWYCGGSRMGGGFKCYAWDGDFNLGKVHSGARVMGLNLTDVDIDNSPGRLYTGAKGNAEFRLKFADALQEYFFNDGPLTHAANTGRWEKMVVEVRKGIVAESARWGDAVGSYTRDDNWEPEVAWVRDTFLANRQAELLAQYAAIGLWPSVDVPVLSRHGGAFTGSIDVTITAVDPVYYTVDGTDPREYGSGAAVGSLYQDPVTIDVSTVLKARAKNGSQWSPLVKAIFVEDIPYPLRVTEVMYNPREPAGAETNSGNTATEFEFIEICNCGSQVVGLAGITISDGIVFDFARPDVLSLLPDERLVVVKDLDAFKLRYTNWASIKIAGEFGRVHGLPPLVLSDRGENVRIIDGFGNTILSFPYDSSRGWPVAADGAGHSLVPLVMEGQTNNLLEYGRNWRASAYRDGSPGLPDPAPVVDVVIGEFMAHTDYTNASHPDHDSNDWIELFNRSTGAVSFADWYLSDNENNLKKWQIPATSTVAAASRMTFFEVDGFHDPITQGFGLSKCGERLFLSYLPGTGEDRVADCVRFKAQEANAALGRYPETYDYWSALPPTTNAANVKPLPHVQIHEIMYHPPSTTLVDNVNDEYVEIHNPETGCVTLASIAGPWRLEGSVEYVFPTNTVLDPGEYLLVVSFDPSNDVVALAAFLDAYGLVEGEVRILGPYSGRLSNRGERLALESPQFPDPPETSLAWVIVDEAIYFDRTPWYEATDGTGRPLQRIFGNGPGNDPENWYAGFVPTPGGPPAKLVVTEPDAGEVLFLPFVTPVTVTIDSSQVTGQIHRVDYFVNGAMIGSRTNNPYDTFMLESIAHGISTGGYYWLSAELTDDGGTYTSRQSAISVLDVDNNSGAQSVGDTSAKLAGRLLGLGEADLAVVWGECDAGTNFGNWDRSFSFGSVTNDSYAHLVRGLLPGHTYHYRYRAVNGTRAGWSDPAAMFVTLTWQNWAYRARIEFDGYSESEVLADFPAAIRFGAGIPGFDYADCASPVGGDIRIADKTGTNWLKHEVELWNTNGESIVWVKLPELTSGVPAWAYWGNANATNFTLPQHDGSTWGSAFDGVWHFSVGSIEDSTSNKLPGIVSGATESTGQLGDGLGFDGDDYVLVDKPAGTNSTLTVSAWVLANASTNTNRIVDHRGQDDVGQFSFGLHFSGKDPVVSVAESDLNCVTNRRGARGGGITLGTWQYLAFVADGTQLNLYQDGLPIGLQPTPAYDGTLNSGFPKLAIGAGMDDSATVTGRGWQGMLDEVRVSSVSRSANWVYACWLNGGGSLATYGPSEPVPQGGSGSADNDGDGMADQWEIDNFGGTNVTNGGPDEDWDQDGCGNRYEYVTGTGPTNGESRFVLQIVPTNGWVAVMFGTIDTEGPAYDGLERYYDLDESSNLVFAPWAPVAEYTNILGDNSTVVFTNSADGIGFYRVRTDLK